MSGLTRDPGKKFFPVEGLWGKGIAHHTPFHPLKSVYFPIDISNPVN